MLVFSVSNYSVRVVNGVMKDNWGQSKFKFGIAYLLNLLTGRRMTAKKMGRPVG